MTEAEKKLSAELLKNLGVKKVIEKAHSDLCIYYMANGNPCHCGLAAVKKMIEDVKP